MTVSAPSPNAPAKGGDGSVKILLYSDNAAVREQVRLAVGARVGPAGAPVQWQEVATHEMAMTLCHQGRFDLVVADNETNKLGGVGLVRQMRAELDWRPQVLLLLARQQDAWLGAWSGADSAILQPADPGALATRVANLLGFPDA